MSDNVVRLTRVCDLTVEARNDNVYTPSVEFNAELDDEFVRVVIEFESELDMFEFCISIFNDNAQMKASEC